MMFSIIIPVYNRPHELDELLLSLTQQTYADPYEVVVIEDGSTITSKSICDRYTNLDIKYVFKDNTGPGDSRNYGMRIAKGDYFIIFDSDCIIPNNYLNIVNQSLDENYVDCFGGPDQAHESFSDVQKAIDFSMTSIWTTGGIRGKKKTQFQPRSFNMGLSKKAFLATNGFGLIHPGEDPELVFRLWELGYQTTLLKDAYVFHKRRIDYRKFYTQVNKFGKVRPIIEMWHPQYSKLTFWFPTLFVIGFLLAIAVSGLGNNIGLRIYITYLFLIWLSALLKLKSLKISIQVLFTVLIQFYGYGVGYLCATLYVKWLRRAPEDVYPMLFFNK